MSKTLDGVSKNRGPWWHRFAIRFCTFLLFLLIYWTLGFLTDDIWQIQGTPREVVERQYIGESLREKQSSLQRELTELDQQNADTQSRASQVERSAQTAQVTWTQLQKFREQAVDKGRELSEEEQTALEDSQRLFLRSQNASLELQAKLTENAQQRIRLQGEVRAVKEEIQTKQTAANQEWTRLYRRHQFWLALGQIGLLIPLMLLAGWALMKGRGKTWAPFAQAFGAAVLLKALVTLHSYFPVDLLIYPLVGTGLVIVATVLWYLIRSLAKPQINWLLKQYQERYQAFLCPVCEYPIRRGPMRFLFWNRKSIARLAVSASETEASNEPYTCPCCATKVFEECPKCHATRHSLLPACESCGDVRELEVEEK
ncbi:hypothetical protein LOC68_05820 [Blastopirellula sp. JC732]|uniref:Zinc ribbon domain-containing protein n=1 Tax=Blastopirellula sediminis TaxID=2894196 RepID=A0A9X1MKF5_9BACT|nr:hypothetical protein [Blastopirellula sediminis]MCC9609318.1 hypothetical protein [Blastopirellula sediminis]MCC9627905.1 hypothetical protein [Blastopirellula sediminis]